MADGHYVALNGMRTKLDELNRLANDIANVGTTGYKTERTRQRTTPRPMFDDALETTIDASTNGRRLDAHPKTIEPTGRSLDLTIENQNFLIVDTPADVHYTRNGHLNRAEDGSLMTADDTVVRNVDGPITVGTGTVTVADDGTVYSDDTTVSHLTVVQFADANTLVRESDALLHGKKTPTPVTSPTVRTSSLEQTNVSIVDHITKLTSINHSFQTLQKTMSILINNVDNQTIESLEHR